VKFLALAFLGTVTASDDLEMSCEHGRSKSRCKECGGSGLCEHGRRKYRCKECGGSGICEHGRRKYDC
jgi:hypothetical protein